MLFEEVTREAYGDVREAEGRLEGERIGIEKGERTKAIETARNLKNKGVDIAIIAECVGLTIEEIEAL